MTTRERTSETVRESAVIVEFSDIPLGMTTQEWRTRVDAERVLALSRLPRLGRLCVRLGLSDPP